MIVTNGVVQLWGFVESVEERNAIRLAVSSVPGVVTVEDHLGTVQPWLWG